MNTVTTTAATGRAAPRHLRHIGSGRRRMVSGLVVTALLSACTGSGSSTGSTDPPVRSEATAADDEVAETQREVGPRALDIEAGLMMVVDAVDVSGDDMFVRVRVVNASEKFVNVQEESGLYGPLLVIRDDHDNSYPARAVEPAGVHASSVGEMRFRIDGPLDPAAQEITFEIATTVGRLETTPIAVPDGGVARWLTESPIVTFAEPVLGERGNRAVQVLDIADRGTHLEVTTRVRDESEELTIPGDVSATLTSADGIAFTSLPLDSRRPEQSTEFTGVLRFLGTLPTEGGVMTLRMAGVDVEIELPCAQRSCPEPSTSAQTELPFAISARLPDLLHFDVKPHPLPGTTIIT